MEAAEGGQVYLFMAYVASESDSDYPEEEYTSPEQVLQRIREIEESYLPLNDEDPGARIINGAGDWLLIGLGRDEWVIWQRSSDGDWVSTLGDENREGFKAFLTPAREEISQERLIPAAAGRRAVETWLETGTLSDEVSWVGQ
jgi:immunity protein Imm1 of predicted polymorphic toxin system